MPDRNYTHIAITALLIISLSVAALPLYYFWWFDIVAHLTVTSFLTAWLLLVVGLRDEIALPVIYSLIIIWEIVELYILNWNRVGYEDTLLDLFVGIVAVAIVLICRSYF
ncbi:hypothetical protein 7841G3A7_30 [Haloquadratum phage sp.]|nr:hypothetical protein 7841G3A7_30 [Haloquadratum phage sp.]UXF50634.1 hypothetical protein 7908G4C8_17 [Haloquadratum phage sp.]